MTVYLDYNASAPIRDVALSAMREAWKEPGNPSSVHANGRRVQGIVEHSRSNLARCISARPEDLIFTSGGTESNNLAISNAVNNLKAERIILASGEHPSVREAALASGLPVNEIASTSDGVVDLHSLKSALDGNAQPVLVAVMLANNETGVLQPIAKIAKMVATAGAKLHVDAVQAFGKIPVNFHILGADTLSIAGHKIGGPTGVGALAIKCGQAFAASQVGGGHELGRRAGTLNTAAIAGFAAAADEAITELPKYQELAKLRDDLLLSMRSFAPDLVVFGEDVMRLPNTLCCSASGYTAETQMMVMDLEGYSISSGSACSSGKVKISHVLAAMGINAELALCAVRISFGLATKRQDIDGFAKAWGQAYARSRERVRA